MRDQRFMIGLVGVALVVTYLIWTGVSDTMVYFLTPQELVAQVEEDPGMHELGIKVGAKVVPDSYVRASEAQVHTFTVHDAEDPSVQFQVRYEGILPDTFTDDPAMEVDVVVEGRYGTDGVFQAHTVLTKCGSRYEASPEELAA